MKFLCPQCKAKYRIADEKLAERASSRMKCRKCGHVIDIASATVPDDSIPPPGVAPAAPEPAPKKAAGATRGTPAAMPQPRRPGGSPTARRPAATVSAVKRPVVPPRRGGAAVAQAVAEKAAPMVEEQALPTAPAATKPAVTKPVSDPPPKGEFDDEPTRIHDGGSLAAAFSSTAGQAMAEAQAPAGADEWYIGIDGSPLGPLGLVQLREKAAERRATFESLVWREGFEEWKPLKEFPELVALVEEARRDAPDQNELRTIPAPSPLEAAARARVVNSDVPSDMLEQLGVKPAKSTSHPAAWAAIIVALAFGVTIGSVLLSKTEKQEVVKYVEVPASAKAAPAASNDPMVIEESTVSANNAKHTGVGAQKPEAAPTATPGKTGLSGLNGLNGLSGLGPAGNQGPDVASNANLPGGQLDGAAISHVVANFTNSVRRGCWDGALASRTPDAPSSARVGVTITIAPSGSVDNVTTTGDPKGYPNLAHCIESKVRAWKFPRSSGTTTAQVPFVFAAQ